MYDSELENELIFPDITSVMGDYVALQPDIDERVVKAAQLMAQNIDIEPIMGEDNLNRVIGDDELTGDDLSLLKLLRAPVAYYTYSRLLLSFQGTFTDSGFSTDELATSLSEAKRVASEMKSLGATSMKKVIAFLDAENPNDDDVDETKLTPKIRVIGGKENRASN